MLTATLYVPGKTPWPIVGKQVIIVERLVKAHQAGDPVLANRTLFAGTSYICPKQAFQGDTWKEYIGHPSGRKQGWTLLV